MVERDYPDLKGIICAGTDFSHIADEIVALYTDGTESREDLLYQPRD